MEYSTESISNATLSKVTIYFIVTKKNDTSGKKGKNQRKKAGRLFLKTYLKHKHTYQYLSKICY